MVKDMKILEGPTREGLALAMVHATKPESATVTFKVQDPRYSLPITRTIIATVNDMQHEDGSGESWNLDLTINGEHRSAYYNSRMKVNGVRGGGVIYEAK